MLVDRYYFQQLNKAEQAVYKAFYKGVTAHQTIIPLPVKGMIPQAAFERIFKALTLDNPLIYYLNQSACNIAADSMGHIAICPQYFWDEKTVHDYNRKIEKAIQEIARKLQLTAVSDYEKEKRIHDWFCENVVYDDKGSDLQSIRRVIAAHNIIGIFMRHRGQCEGIAKAVKVLLNAVDVKCIVVTGTVDDGKKKELHSWNIVKLENVPYHLDVTWDIGHKGSCSRVAYDYFNIDDVLIGKSHKADGKVPTCDSIDQNYFMKNGLCFQSKRKLLRYISEELEHGRREFYFRFEGREKFTKVTCEVADLFVEKITEKGEQATNLKQIPDEIMGTYWIKRR